MPVFINVGDLPPDYDPETHCSSCEERIPDGKTHYVCEETGTKQCSWSCRVTWLEILSRSKDKN